MGQKSFYLPILIYFIEKINYSDIIFVMKKLLISVFLIFMSCFSGLTYAGELRDYHGIELSKGTFIPVINTQEVSTAYCDVGTTIKFITTSDLYLYDTNVIPVNTEFFGYIEKLNEPVVGTNASMIIRISKLKFVDGFELPVKGYITLNGSSLIGGELTPPAAYDKKVSNMQGFKTMLGAVPGASRQMGLHKVIASGADLIIVLVEPLYITHTVTN